MKAAMGILASNAEVNGGKIEFSYHHADGTPKTVDILQKDKKWNDNYVKNEYINCKKAKNPSNKYSLSGIDVI